MPTYVPPKKNTAYTFYVALVDQANTKLFKVNPTISAGDVKVSVDGAAFANATNLPTVVPAASATVQVQLVAAETNGDNIQILFSSATAQWCDLLVELQTTARQIEDLTFPIVSGRGLGVDANNRAQVQVSVIKNIAIANFPFRMTDLSGTPLTGLVDGNFTLKKYRIDAAAAATLSGTITEIDATNLPGMYQINLAAAELNGTVITFLFKTAGSDYTAFSVTTAT